MADDYISRKAAINAICRDWCNRDYCVDCFFHGARQAIDVLKALPSAQPEQRWIPLCRPMSGGMYLVTLRQKFEGEESYRVRIMRLIEGHWMLPKHFPEWINEEMEQEVLAWMPLPEPYREDGEQDG